MAIQFHETVMGKRFYEGTMPRLAQAIEGLIVQLRINNETMREVFLTEIDDVPDSPNEKDT